MRRAFCLSVVFGVGIFAALTVARNATASLSCSTDTASEVAVATVTNLGFNWSSPSNPDPLWDVNMPNINQDVSVYAPDAPGARVKAKAFLDSQVASLHCVTTTAPPTTTTAATTTQAPPTVTVTTPAPDPVTVYVAGPTVTQHDTTTVTVTTEASALPVAPSPVSVTVNLPKVSTATTLNLARAKCSLRGKRVPCARLAGRQVRIVGSWVGKTLDVQTANGG